MPIQYEYQHSIAEKYALGRFTADHAVSLTNFVEAEIFKLHEPEIVESNRRAASDEQKPGQVE